MDGTDARRAIEAVWRIEAAKVIAVVAQLTQDIGLAEECAQDALVAALEHWPEKGIPAKPAAWLITTAKNRALDQLRRTPLLERKHRQLAQAWHSQREAAHNDFQEAIDMALDDDIGDNLLRLIFTACHPLLAAEARVALTLRLLGGLTTHEIARAFLAAEPTVAQRIVRAKRSLSAAQVPFEVPRAEELAGRLNSVLEVIYLIFNEGYAATAGDNWVRPALCEEALRLGRILAGLMPQEAEVQGLVALMEIQASRIHARIDPEGEPILLPDQDRTRWDPLLIRRGLAALDRALSAGPALGPYSLQAAIAACHAQATSAEETDWEKIAALYDALAQLTPSPVIELNRAVAIAMAFGPLAGLEIIEKLSGDAALKDYHLLPSVRGDLLFRLGRWQEARQAFLHAASLTANNRERRLLRRRAAECDAAPGIMDSDST